jgi:ABC-type transport system involved in multi-copper enzyme maturation permease subunit
VNPLGPLFLFELRRVTRRSRPIAGRCAYAALLLVLLGFLYLMLFPQSPAGLFDYLFRNTAEPRELAAFGYAFFVMYIVVQFLVGTVAATTMASSILAEEKERQTLPFLLTTTLSDHEIVLGKLAARLAYTGMLLLSGLPVLALMQVMGGVDPQLLTAGLVATAASLVSAAGVGAAVSITAASVRQANQRALGLFIVYLMGGPYVGVIVARKATAIGATVLLRTADGNWTINDLLEAFNSGNFFWAVSRVGQSLGTSMPLDQALWPVVGRYLLFHALLAAVTIGWVALRMRRVLARQAERAAGKATRNVSLLARRRRRPVDENRPVFWRETATAVDRAANRWYVRWGKPLVFIVTLLPLVGQTIETVVYLPRFGLPGRELHQLVRTVGTIALCVGLLLVGTTAAGCLARERRQKTYDDLRLTRLRNREILSQKAWAAVYAARWIWLWVGLHWLADLTFGEMWADAPFMVVLVYALYVIVAVRLGMFFATWPSPKLRGPPATMLSLFAWGVFPWALPLAAWLYFESASNLVEGLAFFALGVSPPTVLGMLSGGTKELHRSVANEASGEYFFVGLAVGWALAAAAAVLFWRGALRRMARARPE